MNRIVVQECVVWKGENAYGSCHYGTRALAEIFAGKNGCVTELKLKQSVIVPVKDVLESQKLREALQKIITQTDQLIVQTIAERALNGDFV